MQLSKLNLALTRIGKASFSPKSLFSSGAQGAWYDPSDLSTLYEDAAGMIPITTPLEKPVGLMLDKSRTEVLGSTELVSNGDFSNGTTGWTTSSTASLTSLSVSIVSGAARAVFVAGTSGTGQFSQGISVEAGKLYRVTASVNVVSGTLNGNVSIRTTNNYLTSSNTGFYQYANASGATTVSFYYFAVSTTTIYVAFYCYTTSCTVDLDNISVKAYTTAGNHAFQSTTTSRPTLSARYNLLTKTEQFNDAAWSKTNATVASTGYTDPLGGNTARLMLETTTNALHNIRQDATSGAAQHTVSVYVKGEGRQYVSMDLLSSAVAANGSYAGFDLSGAGSVYESGVYGTGFTSAVATITSAGSGWYRITLTVTANVGTLRMFLRTNLNTTTASYAGDPTKGIYIWGADLRVANDGIGLPAYQRVNTATDYDYAGFPPYLKFDGTDDSMATGNIDFTGTDKMFVAAGVRKQSDANYGMIAELSTSFATNTGSFGLYVGTPSSVGAAYSSMARGNAAVDIGQYATISVATPDTFVLTATHDISGDLSVIRRNAVSGTNGTADKGLGNYGNYPLYIGCRGGTTLPYNGRLYSLIVCGKTASASEITSIESYINNKTKAY